VRHFPHDVYLSHIDINLGIGGRAIGLGARVLYPSYLPDRATWWQRAPLSVGQPFPVWTGRLRDG
jgi:hypothetical protein